ncbi:MAG TPA: hypothetical protein VJW51_01615 [Candidatus Acidoferrales bacterium]|nr:hypothetical protein [Candidatus Acidoferrales bacterium]
MDEHHNPWLAVPSEPPYVLPCDSDAIYAFNAKAPEKFRVQFNVLPEPFIGLTTAPVVLLNQNPGFDDQDLQVHARPDFQAVLRNNYCHGPSAFPFYFFDPGLDSPGREWCRKKLRWLLEEFEPKELSRSILFVEYFPYHSRKFSHANLELASQEYGFGLVRSAVARGSTIVIMRARALWIWRIPELEEYSRVFTLNSAQNVAVSPGNCPGFNAVVSAIRDGIVDQ